MVVLHEGSKFFLEGGSKLTEWKFFIIFLGACGGSCVPKKNYSLPDDNLAEETNTHFFSSVCNKFQVKFN